MKSEKAKKCIDANVNYHREIAKPFIGLEYAIHAVECAEQEMLEKAIEAHKEQCHNLCKGYICYAKSDVHNGNWNQCDSNCIYIKDFINQLNNK